MARAKKLALFIIKKVRVGEEPCFRNIILIF